MITMSLSMEIPPVPGLFLTGLTVGAFTEDVLKRFEAYGHVPFKTF